jgi:hypothetical protein
MTAFLRRLQRLDPLPLRPRTGRLADPARFGDCGHLRRRRLWRVRGPRPARWMRSIRSATGGTTTTMSTNRTIVRDLRGCHGARDSRGRGWATKGPSPATRSAPTRCSPSRPPVGSRSTRPRPSESGRGRCGSGTPAAAPSALPSTTGRRTPGRRRASAVMPTAWGTCGQLISTGSAEGALRHRHQHRRQHRDDAEPHRQDLAGQRLDERAGADHRRHRRRSGAHRRQQHHQRADGLGVLGGHAGRHLQPTASRGTTTSCTCWAMPGSRCIGTAISANTWSTLDSRRPPARPRRVRASPPTGSMAYPTPTGRGRKARRSCRTARSSGRTGATSTVSVRARRPTSKFTISPETPGSTSARNTVTPWRPSRPARAAWISMAASM